MDRFASYGFAVYALSLRGHGGSEGRNKLRRLRIRDFVDDIATVVDALQTSPILVGHSMGGFVVQKYLEKRRAPAGVLLASLPPTGVWRTFARTLRDQPLDVLAANLKLSLWPVVSNPAKAGKLLFSPSVPVATVEDYHRRLQDEAWFGYLDTLIFDLVKPSRIDTPMIVMGGEEDRMIRPQEVAATARAYNVEPILLKGTAHDMMLDTGWADVADAIVRELDMKFPQPSTTGVRKLDAA